MLTVNRADGVLTVGSPLDRETVQASGYFYAEIVEVCMKQFRQLTFENSYGLGVITFGCPGFFYARTVEAGCLAMHETVQVTALFFTHL